MTLEKTLEIKSVNILKGIQHFKREVTEPCFKKLRLKGGIFYSFSNKKFIDTSKKSFVLVM